MAIYMKPTDLRAAIYMNTGQDSISLPEGEFFSGQRILTVEDFGAHQNSPRSAQIELTTIRAAAVARKPVVGRALSSTPSGVRAGRST